MEGVSFFSGLEEIGSQAFGQNNLTWVEFPKSLKKVYYNAFDWQKIEDLKLAEEGSWVCIDREMHDNDYVSGHILEQLRSVPSCSKDNQSEDFSKF